MTHPFIRHPENDPVSLNIACAHPQNGLHRFYRMSTAQMQQRFCALIDPSAIPAAFIHGNPHLDNYAKTQAGAAMVDFDRSRFGPYAYDISRFLISVSIKRAAEDHQFLHPVVLDSFRRGYLFGLGGLGQEEMGQLRDKRRFGDGIGGIRHRLLEGNRVAVLPKYFVTQDLAKKRLVPLMRRTHLRSDAFRLIWRKGHPRESALLDLAQDLRTFPLR